MSGEDDAPGQLWWIGIEDDHAGTMELHGDTLTIFLSEHFDGNEYTNSITIQNFSNDGGMGFTLGPINYGGGVTVIDPNNPVAPNDPDHPNNPHVPHTPSDPNGYPTSPDWDPKVIKIGSSFDHPPASPLIIDLNKSSTIELTALTATSKAFFDLDNDGFVEQTGWVQAGDAILCRDVNTNGLIDNITELFGNSSTDGFIVLDGLDGNNDNVINSSDTGFSSLLVWVDADGDGHSDAGELQTLTAVGIASVSLNYTTINGTNQGHDVSTQSTVTFSDSSTAIVQDIWFQHNQANSFYITPEDFQFDPDVFDLPQLRGSGDVADLWTAMSLDGDLKTAVEALTEANYSSFNFGNFRNAVEGILFNWFGVDGVNPTSRGTNIDARVLEGLEAYMGRDYTQYGNPDPLTNAGAQLTTLWDELVDVTAVRILVQIPTIGLSEAIVNAGTDYDYIAANLISNFQALIDVIEAGQPSGGTAKEAYWYDLLPLVNAVADSLELTDAAYVTALSGTYLDTITSEDLSVLRNGSIIVGTDGNDTLTGNGADNYIVGGNGNDSLKGGTQDDIYQYYLGDGNDTIYDVDNNSNNADKILFGPGVTLQNLTFTRSGNDLHIATAGGGSVRVINQFVSSAWYEIENLQFDDTSLFSANQIRNVLLTPTSGNDTIIGYETNDTLAGAVGNDRLEGAKGNDTYIYNLGDGNDTIYDVDNTSNNTDKLLLGTGIGPEDLTFTRTGNDLHIAIAGGGSIRVINQFVSSAWYEIEQIEIQSNGMVISAGDIQGIIDNGGTISGAAFDYTVTGSENAEILSGTANRDLITGLGGNDEIYSEEGNDSVDGGAGNDTVYGWTGDDTLVGGDGADELGGDDGHDSIVGGSGNDALYGYTGNDTLIGGAGADYLIGEGNNDVFKFTSLSDSTSSLQDTIGGFTKGQDKIDLTGLGFTGIASGNGSGTALGFISSGGATTVRNAAGTFMIQVEGSITFDANDFIFGSSAPNNDPILSNPIADQNATEGTAFSFQFASNAFTDADPGDTLSYSATKSDGSALPSWVSFNASTRTFSGTPLDANVGTLAVKVTASDGHGGTAATDIFNIAVANINNAPTVANAIADQTATEGTAFSYQFASNVFADADAGDVLTYSATKSDGTALPSWLSFSTSTRTFSGTPGAANVGTVAVKVVANDGHSGTVNDTFNLTVNHVNHAPTVANPIPNQSATEGSAFTFQILLNAFNDVDAGDTLSYSATKADGSALPSWLAFNASTRTFSGTPLDAHVGAFDVKVTVNDGHGGTVNDTFTLTVANINNAPTVANAIANQSATSGSTFSYQFATNVFADADAADVLTYTATKADGSALPSWIAFNASTRTFSGTPGSSDAGTLSVKVIANDGHSGTVNDVFDIVVNSGTPVMENTITGSSANNVLNGTSLNDLISGLGGADDIYGDAGHDSMDGGTGADTIYGGLGNDTLIGGDAIDELGGDEGSDLINGGAAADNMFGWTGNDTLIGGAGADYLEGGADADRFKYTALTESTASLTDYIGDFIQGTDKIDLSGLGFTGITAGAASGTVLGYNSGGGYTEFTNAAGTFVVGFDGNISLTASDFVFA